MNDEHDNDVAISQVRSRFVLVGLRLELSQALFPSQIALVDHDGPAVPEPDRPEISPDDVG